MKTTDSNFVAALLNYRRLVADHKKRWIEIRKIGKILLKEQEDRTMKITPGIVSEVVRVYKDKFPRSMRDRWEKPEKKDRKKNKEGSISGGCDRSAPRQGKIDKYI